MSPIYEDETTTLADLEKIRRRGKCKVCGAKLNIYLDPDSGKAFVACWDWLRSHHEGIEREVSRYEKEGLASLNIKTRREIMEQEYGPKRTTALDKYMGVVSLTKPQAREILTSIYPDAPDPEVVRAVMLCASYGLNPLMRHVYLMKFNRWNRAHTEIIGEDWATVLGIGAKRLLASRRSSYGYIDGTPRVMTEQEQRTTFGEVDSSKLWVITKLKDPTTGAEAVGYGGLGRHETIQGEEKGNTRFNMAAIRSESQALNRLRPGEMPVGVEVVPEEFAEATIEAEYREVDVRTGEITEPMLEPKPSAPKEHLCKEHNCPFDKKTGKYGEFYAHKKAEGGWCNEKKKKDTAPEAQASIQPSEVPTLEPAPEPTDEPQQPKRDPDTIKTLNDLYKACNEDFKLQPAQVIAELGVSSQSDISDTPAECYRQISSVR